MQFTSIHTYERACDDVLHVLTDPDLVREKYEALGHSGFELLDRTELPDGGIRLVSRRVVPLELPGFAKKVLSPRQSVTQTDTWSAPDAEGRRRGTFEVAAKGTPVRVAGTLRLEPIGATGCTNTIDVTVDCSVPLVGGKIAGFVAGDTRRAVDHEQVWTRAALTRT